MGRLDRLYGNLPVWLQHGAVSAYGLYWNWLRFGPGYTQYVEEYRQRESYSTTQWQRWQQGQLEKLLSISTNHVPYYRDRWSRSEKLAASECRLADLPLLGKEPLRSSPFSFIREDVNPAKRYIFHTSGSTGTPIASVWTAQEIRNSLALREVRSANWAGVSFRQPRATFSGRMVEPDPQSKGPYYRFNIVERQAYLSAFHLRPDTAYQYVNAIHRHKIKWMTGYAVSYYLLAKFVLENNIGFPSIGAVITTSEKVTPEMRRVMEKAFGCKVFEEYSTVENAVFASECEHGKLHVSPDSGIVEILRPDGSPCEPGEAGEVVATCLMRSYQPLIRFRLGDVAMWDPEPCKCGREMPVIKEVVGRVEDVVIGPDGRRMVRFHGIFVDQPHVIEGQIIQEKIDRIRVKVVPTPDFDQGDRLDIAKRIQQRLGPQVEVTVELLDSIPRSTAGKFQAVISKLDRRQYTGAERTGISS